MAPPIADLTSILEAAMDVFYRYGFKKASMDDVARAAGLSRQGLYLKFRSKEELFRVALEHLVSRLLEKTAEISRRIDLDIERRLMLIFAASHGDKRALNDVGATRSSAF